MTPWSDGIQIGPYLLVSSIGSGGMGEVWKARDTRLDRIVAIKRLKGQHTARFEQEARAIAALNHPHICQIYDIGPDYLVMEYVEGEPLRGPLPPAEAVRFVTQVAEALEEAHGKGIIHRDLKPDNILKTRAGVKILDFGLAKLVAVEDSDATRTIEGTVMGTAAYMSPEQAQGKPVDARSDIFAFGLVLYEMLSGRRAFPGGSMADVLSAILRDEPAPLQAPAALVQIVQRCIAKQPSQRYPAIAEVRAALEKIAAKPADQQPSIAVLPFANMSGDKENEYFSDGLAEEIINALAQVPGLKVTARTSAFAFRGKEQDIRGIAEALNVRTILEGSVRRAGNRIRVTAQLINAEDGYHLWSERYDREMADVFAMQDEIAAAIAAKLQLKLAPSPAVARQYTPSLPAYEAFLRGRHHLEKFAPDTIARSKDFFDQAIALDPGYVEPYLALARSYISFAISGMRPAREAMPLTRSLAHKVLELDPSERRAHALLGSVAALYDWNWKEAQERFRLARVGDPVPFEVRATYAPHYLWPLGRFQEAAEEMERAVEQDPLNVLTRWLLVTFLSELGMHERAMDEARKALEIDESHWLTNFAMSLVYLSRGMLAEALASAERAHQLAPWEARVNGLFSGLLIRSGQSERAVRLVEQLKRGVATGMVYFHSLCGETEAAADWYQKAIEQREPNAVLMANISLTKPLRESARWPELAKMMNLPEALES
jgi:TolB-like protein/Tfp pilus assembly protein PilF/predicted Ser/Thr protein kinase